MTEITPAIHVLSVPSPAGRIIMVIPFQDVARLEVIKASHPTFLERFVKVAVNLWRGRVRNGRGRECLKNAHRR
jgi:hypothetical protein